MTNEEQQLLKIQDLSGRLQHGVKIKTPRGIYTVDAVSNEKLFSISNDNNTLDDLTPHDGHYWLPITDDYKSYLRKMSSMTEEEWKEYDWFIRQEPDELIRFRNAVKFYNKHHIDYNDLIPNGLALEAPEGMYNFK